MASSTSDKAVSQEDLSAPQQQSQNGEQQGLGKRILGNGNTVLPRSLKPRHLTFLAIGGTIGTVGLSLQL